MSVVDPGVLEGRDAHARLVGGQHAEAIRAGAECWRCPLADTQQGPVPPTLPDGEISLLVVAEAPGSTEIAEGRTLCGASGREIRTALRSATADPNYVGYTNAMLCRCPGGDLKRYLQQCKKENIPTPIECCRPRLQQELSRTRFAILMGAASLTAVGINGSITKLRGTPVQIPNGPPALPILHAAFVMREEGRVQRPLFHADVAKAVRLSRGGCTWVDPPYFVPKNATEVYNFLAVPRERVATDVETDGKDAWTCRLRRIGIGTNREVMIYAPLSVRGHALMASNEIEACRRVIAAYFQSGVHMGLHNGIAFDSIVLHNHGMPLRDDTVFDTMVGHQVGPTSELPHRLDFLGSMYTDAPFWKDDVKHSEIKDDTTLDRYLSYDIAVTFLSEPYVAQNVTWAQQEHIYNLDAELYRHGRSMAALGVWIDPEVRWKFAAEYQEKSDRLRKEFCDVAGRDINPGSPVQVRKLLYQDLGLPMLDEHMTHSGDPSTDEPTLLDLLALGLDDHARKIIHGLLGFREAEKLLGVNTGHIVNGRIEGGPIVHADGCVRASWRPGKRSGRWGSNDPNMQNIPSKLRAMFRPMPGKGNKFVAADAQAQELRMIALLADDRDLIEAFKAFDEKRGPDVHTFNACTVFRCKPEEVTKPVRDLIKRFVYALSYDAQPPTIHRTLSLLRDDNLNPMFGHITLPEVERLYNLWWKLHPAIPEWKKKLIYGWRATRYIATNLHGRKRYFIGGESPTEMPNHDVQGCYPASTRVLTRAGYVAIGLAPPIGEVWTGTKWAPYRVLDRGVAQRARLVLASGQTIQCDTRHQLLVQTEQRYEFRHYRDLKRGDRVCMSIARPLEFGGAGSPDEFYWLGFAIGNGSTARRNHLAMTFGDRKGRYQKEDAAQRFEDYVRACGYVPQKRGVYEGKIMCRVEHKAWRARWEALGYNWAGRSHTKRVPASVWTASLECRRQFLLGLLDSDGTVGGGKKTVQGLPALHMCQFELLQEVQQLLRTCGVESTLRGPYKPGGTKPDAVSWRLDMSGFQLNRYFNYGRSRRSAVAVRWMPAPRCVTAPIGAIQLPRGALARALTESQQVLRLRAMRGGRMNVYTMIDLYGALGRVAPECYASYELVKKRALRRRERTYTLSVDDPGHRFDAEGVISKNSSASMQNDAIRAFVSQYPFDYANHRGLLINGHDQLVVECAEREVPAVKQLLQTCMQKRVKDVLFPADPKAADDWKAAS